MQYEPIQPGLFRLQMPNGPPMVVPTTEDELRAAGHTPLTAPGSGALAQFDPRGDAAAHGGRLDAGGGLGGSDDMEVVNGRIPALENPDVRPPAPGGTIIEPNAEGGYDSRQVGAPQDRTGAPRGVSIGANGEYVKGTGEAAPAEGEGKPGTKKIRVEIPSSGAAGGGGGAGHAEDVLASYTVKKGVPQGDLDAAEAATADASIDRKAAAQAIAERQQSRPEAESAAMGRDIRREEIAVRQQEQRNNAMRADFAERQAAIDKERADVDQLKVNPRQYFDDMPAWAKVLSVLSLGFGGLAQSTGHLSSNAQADALNAAVQQSIDAQKANISGRRQNLAGRENELERLTKIYGSPDAAEAELRDRKRSLIQAYAQKSALDAGATDIPDNLKATFSQWDAERAEQRLERERALGDQVVETHKRTWMGGPGKPKKASAGQEKVAGLIGSTEQVIRDLSPVPGETSTALPEEGNILTRANKAAHEFIGGKGAYERSLPPEENEMRGRLQTSKVALKGLLGQAVDKRSISESDHAQLEAAIDAAHDAAGLKRSAERVRATLAAKLGGMQSVGTVTGGGAAAPAGGESEGGGEE